MIVTREQFLVSFHKWIDKKLKGSLPEEDYDGSMFKQALEVLYKHKQEMKDLAWPE